MTDLTASKLAELETKLKEETQMGESETPPAGQMQTETPLIIPPPEKTTEKETAAASTSATPAEDKGESKPLTEPHDTVVHHDEKEGPTIKRVIVFPVDDSENSAKAVNWALDNLLQNTDLAYFINVRPMPMIPGPFGTAYMDYADYLYQLDEQGRHNSHHLLHRYAMQVKQHGIPVKAVAMRGDAREEICRKVDEIKADLVVMGSRGMGIIKRTLLGSVSDYCIHHLKCPIMIIKQTDAEIQAENQKREKQRAQAEQEVEKGKERSEVGGPSASQAQKKPVLVTPASIGH